MPGRTRVASSGQASHTVCSALHRHLCLFDALGNLSIGCSFFARDDIAPFRPPPAFFADSYSTAERRRAAAIDPPSAASVARDTAPVRRRPLCRSSTDSSAVSSRLESPTATNSYLETGAVRLGALRLCEQGCRSGG
ncbi:hypothetical protein TOPH_00916 [Tolypocladium ophioglossoides CBS 100239]|uniref:Uncharacterized protein n=1 Tax=Tolypocladium ophioglossoides (strain CBS 100239) TaxID=1163406 RepID=A0A0L0NJY2_TOLOC|nr:hypothetical protein TOPH_00916 [Tolypocladium ophioglossoides CBS 100239]